MSFIVSIVGYCRYVTALVKVEATVTLANDSVKIFTECLFGMGLTRSDRIEVHSSSALRVSSYKGD